MRNDESEELGTDLEQMKAMLEQSEIDYNEDYLDEDGDEDEAFTVLDINDTVRMIFDEEGTLLEVSPIPN